MCRLEEIPSTVYNASLEERHWSHGQFIMPCDESLWESRMREICMSGLRRGEAAALVLPLFYSTVIRGLFKIGHESPAPRNDHRFHSPNQKPRKNPMIPTHCASTF